MESIRHSYTSTIDELNEDLLAIKEEYEQLQSEYQTLKTAQQPQSLPLQTSDPNVDWNSDEIVQLREQIENLNSQCSQLTETNLAWQTYHQNQLNQFRTKLNGHLSL